MLDKKQADHGPGLDRTSGRRGLTVVERGRLGSAGGLIAAS